MVSVILDNLAAGAPREDILRAYPALLVRMLGAGPVYFPRAALIEGHPWAQGRDAQGCGGG